MAHSPHALAKLEQFLHRCAAMSLEDLAQQHLIAGEEFLETEDMAHARTTRAVITCIDAIGSLKFPREWQQARDNAGLNQANA